MPQKTSTKTVVKEKIHGPPREKQTPLEMGTGGGGGKRGGGGGKKLPEDKIEFEEFYKKYDDDDDSSTETSLELEVTPEQLSRVNPNRPILRLRLSPRKRVATAAPGGGGSPPAGGITQTGPPEEGPGHERNPQEVVEDCHSPQEAQVVEDYHSPQVVQVVEAHHGLQKAVEGHLDTQVVEEELPLLVVMVMENGNGQWWRRWTTSP